jgi:non-specific serine/threonine protein kinase
VGGTGKTRLSLQVAADSLDQFPDGVWFVELAALTDPSIIPGTILSAAGVPEQRGMTVQQLLLDYLREKKLLLMLDNCEHLIEACARLTGTLLSNSPALNILATSREALGVAGEMIWQVPSLSLPDVKQLSNTEQLSQYEAVQLFVERATLVQPHFNVTNENAPAVAQICFRLDGIPLAIELAAARVRALSVDQISKRLDDRFRLLTGGSRTALERHQTLRAALDWSYNLLSPEEKVLLGRLSVFTGGWTLEAAEQVCDWGDGEFDVLDFLTQLVEKSLVNANVLGNDTRYSMLETTRQYAREKLFDSNEGESLHNRHAEYFLILAGKADQQVHGPYQLEWINRFEAEHDNLRAAFEWSLAAKQTENAVRLFNCIHWAWHLRGHFSEMSEWFEKIDTLPDIEAFPLQYARTLTNAASWEWLQGKLMEARSHLTQSRSICMELGVEGEAELAWALTWLAHIGRIQGTDLAEAASLAKDALQLHQKWGNKIGVAFSTFFLGAVQANQGLPSAKQTLEHSLELFHQLGDSWGIARASQLLGSTYLETGDFEKAKKYFERHLFLDETSDFKAGICAALDDLAHLYRAQGDFIQAKQFFQKSIQLAQDYGILPSYSLYGLSMIALAQNDYESALSLFTELFDRAKTQAASDLLMGLAAISAGLGQPERSATLYGAAQLIMDTSDYKYSPYDMTEFERHIQLAREQLGNARFEALAAEGRLMTMEQAIELALERSDG